MLDMDFLLKYNEENQSESLLANYTPYVIKMAITFESRNSEDYHVHIGY